MSADKPIPDLEPWHAGVVLSADNEWATPAQEAELHEPTIRACIEALADDADATLEGRGYIGWARARLVTLLPAKPNKAEELAEQFKAECPPPWWGGPHDMPARVIEWLDQKGLLGS
jgi:hypothetical protein